MSLQLAAKHLESKGRGPDDTLVHMSRGEVKSLNDLAMAHGGQLTINPHTGLPEAGFLSSMLPMLAGMALAPATGGASLGITSAWQTAALVGAGSYLLNPKAGLMGGLMAGLGAYGGAGLGEALAQQGMQQAAGQKIAEEQATNIAGSMAPTPNVIPRFADPAVAYAQGTPLSAMSPEVRATLFDAGTTTPLSPLQAGAGATPAQLAAVKPTDFMGRADMLGQGIKSTFTDPNGFSSLYNKMGGGFGTAKSALAAAAPLATLQTDAPAAPVVDKDRGQQYSYSAGVAQPLPSPDVPTYEDMLTKQNNFGKQQNYYPNQGYTPISNDQAKQMYHYAADGGLMGYAGGGPVEQMSSNAMMGVNTMYPMANISTSSYGTPDQMAEGGISGSGNLDLSIPLDFGGAGGGGFGGGGANGYSAVGSGGGTQTPFAGQNNTGSNGLNGPDGLSSLITKNGGPTPVNPMADDSGMHANNSTFSDTFQPQGTRAFNGNPQQMMGLLSSLMQGKPAGNSSALMASGGMTTGGISDAGYNLGGYSDGGRLLRGPGDGVSDSIPAVIGKKQPARLADGEFVVPARIVSELGNGSTEAGARKLYGMMDRVQAARGKTVGKGKVAQNSRADKYLPA